MKRHSFSSLIMISLLFTSLEGEPIPEKIVTINPGTTPSLVAPLTEEPISDDRASPASVASSLSTQSEEEIVSFSPPQGWFYVDRDKLKPSVLYMIVGKAKSSFPPSMNLTSQPYSNSLKQYLKMIKEKNASEGYEWKDLGTIKTKAGNASLSQVDTKTEWGSVRFMHVILLKNGRIFILTAAALTEEFSFYYKDFFESMSSLNIVKK